MNWAEERWFCEAGKFTCDMDCGNECKPKMRTYICPFCGTPLNIKQPRAGQTILCTNHIRVVMENVTYFFSPVLPLATPVEING